MKEPMMRPAHARELPTLYELAREGLSLDRFSPDLLAEKLFRPRRPETFAWAVDVAEVGGRIVGFLQHVASAGRGKAWLGLGVVASEHRRRGVGRALFEHARAQWPAEVKTIDTLGIPGNYFVPGLDPRYTTALCFLERLGFARSKDASNLRVDLARPFDTRAEAARLAKAGIEVRRATHADTALLDGFFAANFGEDWRFEAALAMEVDPPALHLALRGGELIAFSAHSTQNREWGFFGPMGTTEAARGQGLGRILLWHCLNDLRDAGHKTGVIPWVGPIAFYHQWAGCVVERVFWRYQRER